MMSLYLIVESQGRGGGGGEGGGEGEGEGEEVVEERGGM